ncbi:mucin-5AC-like [Rana temporaria]|uniref:mucin-5AC-like n=1 Tax=Rana temporaria TaxID=8407 RepID=UPI001AACF902|nr:mucin-5AC-like [Rana temporaria]
MQKRMTMALRKTEDKCIRETPDIHPKKALQPLDRMLSTLILLFVSVVYTESQIHSCNSGYAVLVPCCTTADHLTDDITNVYCPSGCMSKSLYIWGTDIYTANSPICMAAIHAGVGSNGGGYITVVKMPGQANYISSIKNGIGSLSYQTSARSFMLFTNLTASTVYSSTIAAVPSTSPPTSSTDPGFTSADNVSPSSSTALPASSSSSTALPASSTAPAFSTAFPSAPPSSTVLPATSDAITPTGVSDTTTTPPSSTNFPATSNAIITTGVADTTNTPPSSTDFPATSDAIITTSVADTTTTLPSSTDFPATSNAIITTGVADTTNTPPSSTDFPATSDAITTTGVSDTTTTLPSSTNFPATSDATITTGYSDSTTAYVKAGALVNDIASMSDILQSDSSSVLAADTILAANTLSANAPITSATPIQTAPITTDLTTTNLVDIGPISCSTYLDLLTGDTLRVWCPASCDASYIVWGTKIYTSASDICASAIHAGALPAAGGYVTLKRELAQSSYSGTYQNGIQSRSTSYSYESMVFV